MAAARAWFQQQKWRLPLPPARLHGSPGQAPVPRLAFRVASLPLPAGGSGGSGLENGKAAEPVLGEGRGGDGGASDGPRAVGGMSLSPKMLPCKKRRTAVVGPEKEDLGVPSGVPSVEMETSISSGTSQLCSLVPPKEEQEDPDLSRRKGPLSPPAGRPPCLSPGPAGDRSSFDDEVAEEAEMLSEGTAQKGCPEGSESPLRNVKLSPKEGAAPSSRGLEDHQDPRTAPSPEFLVDKEEVKLGLTVGRALPKPTAAWEEGEDLPGEKAPGPGQSSELAQDTKDEAEETGLFIPVEEPDDGGKRKRRKAVKRKREGKAPEGEEEGPLAGELKLDDTLDRTLEDGAKQHNLTAVNVRNILHEVITNEHVVAMMKAAISETEDIPIFEPKMTRSKLKEVVEKGVVIPTWNISPIKKANEIKPPQFVDIPLEEDDSSDEEYQPEEEEDETAEETLVESDVESTASSPRGAKRSRSGQSSDAVETDEEAAAALETEKAATPPLQRHISAEVVPMGPPPPPKPKPSRDSTFMEKLHAVDEELASSPVCMEPFQPLEDSLIALRTRSKRPLKDVPLGRLEAELRAPDITPDMYDPNTADDEEWKCWLSGLMSDDVGNEDEGDDDDDPEYNFLEDLDEPDTEDFRNDRAVRITKKEVNELMEELFQTFQEEMGFSNVEDEGPEDDDSAAEARPDFNTPQVLRFEEPLANLLNEQHRTVKEQLEQLRMKKSAPKLPQESERAKLRNERPAQALTLDAGQRKRLAQQMQQHVQLLTQIHLLSSSNPSLSSEASTTRLFLTELDTFAQSSLLLCQPHGPTFQTAFQPCNLKEALHLIQVFHDDIKIEWSPRKAVKKNVNDFACLPKQLAWILATRRVFMYPELLPTCSLKAKTPRDKIVFTKGEDNLLALGLKHFEGTEFPKPLISKYLLTTKTAHQLTVRIKNLNMNRVPDNILKYYKTTKQLPALPRLCEEIQPGDWKPPIEREEHRLPFWLKASLPFIQEALEERCRESSPSDLGKEGSEPTEPGADGKYPLRAPEGLQMILRPLNSRFCRKAWRRQRPAATKPLPVRPGLCPPSSASLTTGSSLKTPAKHPQPEAPPSKVGGRVPRLIQPAPLVQPLPGVQHLSLQAAVGNRAGFELQGVFSAPQPGPRACLAGPVQPGVVPALPVAFQPKMILPALPASKVRKPGAPRGYQKRKSPRPTPLLKVAPLLHPAPVIFTVPAGAVKVVSISNSCNMLQPLAATTAAGGASQSVPITALLVNPAPFPCALSQPLAGPSTPSVVVTSSPVCPLASPPLKDAEAAGRPAANNVAVCPIKVEPTMEPQEPSSCSTTSAEEDCGTWAPDPEQGVQAEDPIPACAETADESPPNPFSPLAEMRQATKAGAKEGPSDPLWEEALVSEDLLSKGPSLKEELVLGLGQELNVDSAPLFGNKTKESLSKPSAGGKEEPSQREGSQRSQGPDASPEDSGYSFEGVRSSLAGGLEAVGSRVKPEDSSGAGGAARGPPAGHEAIGEKEGPEEEEEEDFDDDIQDEEDEEMSSASEESVLSVPELQETMEKLTWLASERRLSQEGDSEEENSPEENSEPEEEEEEEEEEGENPESLRKEDEMADEVADPGDGPVPCPTLTSAVPEVEPRSSLPDENTKAAPGKNRSSSRARAKRGRGRASKDTSKLLLLYDEDILERDPLREQKDLAFAQAYLSRVREALRHQPGKYEAFLRIIYEFENNARKQTAIDLYAQLRNVLQEWPQLLTDFAAFLLPEQALECGLFEEQQAFEKSRKFLRQLEICFAENPSHHQKIIKVLQSCAESLPQEIMELKTQMWQLLKGHDHLQDEFSIFFDHLRPSASRLGDFEEINWTEEKDYEFDGFEDVSLPDMEEEEEPPKIHATPKNKRRKEFGGQNTDKEPEGAEGPKECASCPEGTGDFQMKRSKRRSCGHKAGEGKAFRHKDPQEVADALGPREPSPRPEGKESAEDSPERREDGDVPPGRMRAAGRRTDAAGAGSHGEGKLPVCGDRPPEAVRAAEGSALPGLPCPKKAGEAAKQFPADPSPPQIQKAPLPKLPRPKTNSYPGETDVRLGLREEVSSGSARDKLEPKKAMAVGPTSSAVRKCPQTLVHRPGSSDESVAPSGPDLQDKGANGLPTFTDVKPQGREVRGLPLKGPPAGTGRGMPGEAKASSLSCLAADPKAKEGSSPSQCLPGPKPLPPAMGGRECSGPLRGEDALPRATEAATVCAKNIKVSSTGEKVVLWTREADRVILTACQDRGANPDTFRAISQQLQNKTAEEVAHRFRELMALFHTACEVSSEDEEDGLSASNTDPVLSEEEQEEPGFEV